MTWQLLPAAAAIPPLERLDARPELRQRGAVLRVDAEGELRRDDLGELALVGVAACRLARELRDRCGDDRRAHRREHRRTATRRIYRRINRLAGAEVIDASDGLEVLAGE